MRLLPLLALASCGAPAFVPVTVYMQDVFPNANYRYLVAAEATLKLNPRCASNCELAQAIEDGGSSYLVFSDDGMGPRTSPARMIAPGADLVLTVHPVGVESCRSSYVVPAAGLKVNVTRHGSGVCAWGL